jgi:isocitrate dehydrogenase
MTRGKIPIAVAYGDGIGPEIMEATLFILQEAGADLEIHPIELGEKVYLKGNPSGIEPKTWETIRQTKALLKAPITTPQGGGFKSLNVTIRTSLGLYANVRPCRSYAPFVATKHPKMDLVIIRENEEDLYTGIEYQQTPDVCCSLKMISAPGTKKIIRYAFEYARTQGRKKVSCFTKDNIMKLSDGLFHRIFEEIAKDYSEIANEHWIVDIGAAKLADTPELFDVIVLPNLYGDILSDVAAQISGSVGLAGSANIGDRGAMFEAIHGSAPRRAGQNLANPSGLLMGAIQMLVYLGMGETAARIQNSWLYTLESGIHTYDIYKEGISKEKVGTQQFAFAVAKSLGKEPSVLKPVSYHTEAKITALAAEVSPPVTRACVGVDIFLYSKLPPLDLQRSLTKVKTPLALQLMTNRGAKVWPEGQPETFCIDQFRCRYMAREKGAHVFSEQILDILKNLYEANFDIIKTENLYLIGDKAGFSSAEM